jgi:hypothetical protein
VPPSVSWAFFGKVLKEVKLILLSVFQSAKTGRNPVVFSHFNQEEQIWVKIV